MNLKLLLKIVASSSIIITLLAVISASAITSTQIATSSKEKADVLFSLFEDANSTCIDVFNLLKNAAISVPQLSLSEYMEAQKMVGEATSLYQKDNYTEASSQLVQALQKLKETLRIIYETTNIQKIQGETNLERTTSLNSSIYLFYSQLSHLENLTLVAQQAGFIVAPLTTKIAEAKLHLRDAQESLVQGQYAAVQGSIDEVKAITADLTNFLSTLALEIKIQRLETYIAETEERLNTIKAEATSTSNTASLSAVNLAETSLNNAKTYLEHNLVNATITELLNSKESEDQAISALKPPTSSSTNDSLSSTSPNATAFP